MICHDATAISATQLRIMIARLWRPTVNEKSASDSLYKSADYFLRLFDLVAALCAWLS